VAIRAFDTVEFGVLDLVVVKRRSFVKRMARLSAAFPFAAVFGLFFGLLDDIAGRRLGRIA
jgi:hypothetical protein